jgi:hypothetical protein
MSLDQNDILKIEDVGQCADGKIVHVLLKGGLSIIGLSKDGSEMQPIATGPLFRIAKVAADNIRKGIQWAENLFKSEEGDKTLKFQEEKLIESITPFEVLAYGRYMIKKSCQEYEKTKNLNKSENPTAYHDGYLAMKQYKTLAKKYITSSRLVAPQAIDSQIEQYLAGMVDYKNIKDVNYEQQYVDAAIKRMNNE